MATEQGRAADEVSFPALPARLATPFMMRALELHEARAHAHGSRTVTDLGDAVLLADTTDPDPFVNRISALRLPADDAAFDVRLTELLGLFAVLNRRPHIWLSPAFGSPPDAAARLAADGFVDLGGTFTMALDGGPPPVDPPAGARVERRSQAGHQAGAIADAAAKVMVEAFGAELASEAAVADDLRMADGGAWDVSVVLVGNEPVAAGRRYTADGMTYLSSISTRPAWWGRGYGATVTAALAADGCAAGGDLVHLGVEAGNTRAQRLYARLGFAIVGDRMADLLLG